MLRRSTAALCARAYHPQSSTILDAVLRRTPGSRADPVYVGLSVASVGTFVGTYGIIGDWVYQSYLDLWDGTYGLDDDDDDDD
jgi:hypothetical protein